MKMFYSLVTRQAQWNTNLQKHTDIILISTILCYLDKVSLQRKVFRAGQRIIRFLFAGGAHLRDGECIVRIFHIEIPQYGFQNHMEWSFSSVV